jgi:hypothetical protein
LNQTFILKNLLKLCCSDAAVVCCAGLGAADVRVQIPSMMLANGISDL